MCCFIELSLNRERYAERNKKRSDLGPKIGYEAIGVLDASLKTVAVWAHTAQTATADHADVSSVSGASSDSASPASGTDLTLESRAREEEYNRGVVFYLADDKVVGILLWNLFGQIPLARKILASERPIQRADELAGLFPLYDQPKA